MIPGLSEPNKGLLSLPLLLNIDCNLFCFPFSPHNYVSGLAERAGGAVRELLLSELAIENESFLFLIQTRQRVASVSKAENLTHTQTLKEELC